MLLPILSVVEWRIMREKMRMGTRLAAGLPVRDKLTCDGIALPPNVKGGLLLRERTQYTVAIDEEF